MKCLENIKIEQVKGMSFSDLEALCENIGKEEWMAETKQSIIAKLKIMKGQKPLIEN